MAAAVGGIAQSDDQGDRQHQQGVGLELVRGREVEPQCDKELQRALKQTDPCVGGHILVGRDAGVVWYGEEIEHQHPGGALQDPAGGIHAAFGYIHPAVQEP